MRSLTKGKPHLTPSHCGTIILRPRWSFVTGIATIFVVWPSHFFHTCGRSSAAAVISVCIRFLPSGAGAESERINWLQIFPEILTPADNFLPLLIPGSCVDISICSCVWPGFFFRWRTLCFWWNTFFFNFVSHIGDGIYWQKKFVLTLTVSGDSKAFYNTHTRLWESRYLE